MNGRIKTLIKDRMFGFILGENGIEYFFHRDDFKGHWSDLVKDFGKSITIDVNFDIVESPKGPRAANISRADWPNQAV